jgi:serine/threonine protein kinase
MLLTPGVEDIVTPAIEGEIELQGATYPLLKAQPLPHTFEWDDKPLDAECHMFCLNDMGNGERLVIMLVIAKLTSGYTAIRADGVKNYESSTPYALRAPEIILRAGYDSKIDIWAIGCMVSDTCFN